MFTVRVTFWAVILLTILSSLLDGSGDFDVKLTRIENGNSTIQNAINEINIESKKSKLAFDTDKEVAAVPLDEKEKKRAQDGVAEIHSSFGETLSSNADFKSEILHGDSTNSAPSVSEVDVPNRISETGQAVVFTLVDSASIELQNRASPALPHTDGDAAANLSHGGGVLVNDSADAIAAASPPRPPHRDRGTATALPTSQPAAAAAAAAAPPPPALSIESAPPLEAAASAGASPPAEASPQAGGANVASALDAPAAPEADADSPTANVTDEPDAASVVDAGPDATIPPEANDTAAPEDVDHYIVRAEPKQVDGKADASAASSVVAETDAGAEAGTATDSEASPPSPAPIPAPAPANVSAEETPPTTAAPDEPEATTEDIPSFNEWTQRQLAEAEEKKKVLNGSAGGPASGSGAGGGAGAGGGGVGSAAGDRPTEGSGGGGGGGGGGAGGKALKLRSKNYASPDCGAKIVAANPEAVSPGAVLSASRDEYMLNTCTTRIWFVVELCEAIQAKKVELANFELFSSSPREFSVLVSDRVQGREWRPVGRFSASEERSVQSFALNPQLFGRYIKVEVLSHHGSEHFCPLSLFRVYGTSEFEVLEKVDRAEADEDGSAAGGGRLGLDGDDDDDDDEDETGSGAAEDEDVPLSAGDPPRNLFESYKNAVLSIVKQAAQALTKSGDGSNETVVVEPQLEAGATNTTAGTEAPADNSPSSSSSSEPEGGVSTPSSLCKSPRHLVVCDNCSDSLYSDVFALLSCRERDLEALMASAYVADSLRESGECARYGLAFARRRPGAPFPLPAAATAARAEPGDFFAALFPPEYVAALCNLLAIADRRVALNVSDAPNVTTTARIVPGLASGPELVLSSASTPPTTPLEEGLENALPPVTCTLGGGATRSPQSCPGGEDLPAVSPPVEDLASQIKPTKTLAKEESGEDTAAPAAPALEGSEAPVVPATEVATSATATAVHPEETAAPAAPASASAAATSAAPANVTATPTAAAPAIPPPAPVVPPPADEAPVDAAAIPPSEPDSAEAEASDGEATSSEEPSQENLDTLLRDLKDLDQSGETGSSGVGTPAPSTTATPPTAAVTSAAAPNTPPPAPAKPQSQSQTQSVQKESVFVRLANRIKALERNMSLSGQYLEELSRRYKKQVEEMQKAFNRTLQAVHEAGRIGEEREAKRLEEMQLLQQQLLQLAGMVEHLLGEKNSWFSQFSVWVQHGLLICVEVLIFICLMYFCRKLPPTEEIPTQEVTRKVSAGVKNRKGRTIVKRRKSVEGVSGHESPRTRNRRPSEEALHIAGSYQDLLISEPRRTDIDGRSSRGLDFGFTSIKVDSRRRRRKKKDTLLRSASIRLPVRSSEPLIDVTEEQAHVPGRRASSLELGVWWASSNGLKETDENIEVNLKLCDSIQQSVSTSESSATCTLPSAIESLSAHSSAFPVSCLENDSIQKEDNTTSFNSFSVNESKIGNTSDTVSPLSQNNGLVRSSVSKIQRQFSSPLFMRTATSVRSSRLGSSVEPSPPAKLKSDNWEWYSTHHGLDKSSQPSKVKCSVSCPGGGLGDSDQRQNGHTDGGETRRNSNASSSASSASNISEAVARKDNSKKGPSSLKKMVRKFF